MDERAAVSGGCTFDESALCVCSFSGERAPEDHGPHEDVDENHGHAKCDDGWPNAREGLNEQEQPQGHTPLRDEALPRV
jgi:hypothetical protein